MKAYRGTLLASAVLLSLSGCGDAEKWEKSDSIVLSTSTPAVIVKQEVLLTVQSIPPVVGYACDTLLEYRAEGAGMDRVWYPVPGSETTRLFVLKPYEVGTLSVIARGKCAEAKEDWKYSNQVDVEVQDPATPTVALTLTANPGSVVKNNPVTFTLGATRPSTCSLRLRYQYSGAGWGVTTVDPASTGQFILTPTVEGTLTVTATGWCTQNPTNQSSATVSVPVTAVALPTITTPDMPSGASSVTHGGRSVYTSGGAICSDGDSVQYQFTATGNPTEGSPSPWSGFTFTPFTWPGPPPAPVPYTVSVTAQARCRSTPSVVSGISGALSVTVN